MTENKLLGNIYILLTTLFLSFSTVYTHRLVQGIDPLVFAFYSFLFVIITVAMIRFKIHGFHGIKETVASNFKDVIYINLSSAIDWVLFLVALKYINAYLVNVIVFGIAPIGTLLLTKSKVKKQYLFAAIILLLLLAIGLNYVNLTTFVSANFSMSVVLCILAGLAVGGSTIFLKNLSQAKMKVLDVILIRYFGVVIIAAIWILFKQTPLAVSPLDMAKILSLSFLFVLLPAFFVQKGIAYVSPFTASLLSSSIPALTYLIEAISMKTFNIVQIFIILLLSLALFLNSRLS